MSVTYDCTSVKQESEISEVLDGLHKFNASYFGGDAEFLAIYAKSKQGEIFGGALTYSVGTDMLLDTLWVNEEYRGQKIGCGILKLLEEKAIAKGIKTIFTDTHSFQAEDFYLKQGFEIHGRLEEYLGGFAKIFLRKKL